MRIITLLVLQLLSLSAPVLYAQQEPRLFRLSDLGGALMTRFQYTEEEETAGGDLLRQEDRNYLEGGLQLNVKGSIYHPNLLSFAATVNLVAHRTKRVLFSDSSVNDALNNTYNVRMMFFKKKKVSLDLYAIRNYSTADRAFVERYFTTHNSLGGVLRTRSKLFPLQLDIYHYRMKSESLSFAERDETSDNLDFRVDLLGAPRSKSVFRAKAKDYSESVYNVHYKSLESNLSFIHNYGVKDRSVITSLVSYHRMTGHYDLETYNASANIMHFLKSNLFLRGIYNLTGDNSFNRSFTRHLATVAVNHLLYESLNTELQLLGKWEDDPGRRNDAYGYQARFRYTKRIPTGNIHISFSRRNERGDYVSHQDISSAGDIFEFPLNDAIILTTPGIDIDSIQITSPDLSLVYVRDVDYTADVLGDALTITRLPGGTIPEGGSVAIQYQYLAFPDYVHKLSNTQFLARLNFLKYFYVYYSSNVNSQDIQSDYLIPPFDEYNKRNAGAQFMSKFLNVHYIYEDYSSTLADYISHNFRLTGNIKLFRTLRLTGNLNINRLDYKNGDFFNHFDAYTAECMYTPKAGISAQALYRNLRYSSPLYERTRESLLFKFQWEFRKIILDVFYERILNTSQLTDRGHNYFSIMLRRSF